MPGQGGVWGRRDGTVTHEGPAARHHSGLPGNTPPMTNTPQAPEGFHVPPQAEAVEDDAMDEVLDSYAEAIEDSPDAGETAEGA